MLEHDDEDREKILNRHQLQVLDASLFHLGKSGDAEVADQLSEQGSCGIAPGVDVVFDVGKLAARGMHGGGRNAVRFVDEDRLDVEPIRLVLRNAAGGGVWSVDVSFVFEEGDLVPNRGRANAEFVVSGQRFRGDGSCRSDVVSDDQVENVSLPLCQHLLTPKQSRPSRCAAQQVAKLVPRPWHKSNIPILPMRSDGMRLLSILPLRMRNDRLFVSWNDRNKHLRRYGKISVVGLRWKPTRKWTERTSRLNRIAGGGSKPCRLIYSAKGLYQRRADIMDITWLGHSSIKIVSRDVTLVTDPYPDSIGFSMGAESADIVTVSNDHPNHSETERFVGDPRVLQGPGQFEVRGYNIRGMGTKFEEPERERRINTVFTFRSEGISVCHLGDLKQRLTPAQLDGLGAVDVLVAPAGGRCTLEVREVVALANQMAPKIIIPVHYGYETTTEILEPLERILTELGVAEATPLPRLNVTQTNMPREMQAVVLRKSS